jgi:quercetin dioxygenase-like cupin family protein
MVRVMTNGQAPPLTVVQPGGGTQGDLGSIGVVFKLWGHDTGGAMSIVEHPFPVGALVPPHLHTREDEYSIVTEGQIGFRSGEREVVLGPGGYITKPRGELHAMWNAGPWSATYPAPADTTFARRTAAATPSHPPATSRPFPSCRAG